MDQKLLLILADGFEEVEALAPVDFLRRLGFDITIAGLDKKIIKSTRNVAVETDIEFSQIKEIPDALILPGGAPGFVNLNNSRKVIDLVIKTNKKGNLVAAICAAPIVLHTAGILSNKKITAHPGVKGKLINTNFTGVRVEQDGNIITSKGPGTAFEFAAKIASYLGKKQEAEKLLKEMFVI